MVSEMVAYLRAQCLLKVVEDERKAMRNIFWGNEQGKGGEQMFVRS